MFSAGLTDKLATRYILLGEIYLLKFCRLRFTPGCASSGCRLNTLLSRRAAGVRMPWSIGDSIHPVHATLEGSEIGVDTDHGSVSYHVDLLPFIR